MQRKEGLRKAHSLTLVRTPLLSTSSCCAELVSSRPPPSSLAGVAMFPQTFFPLHRQNAVGNIVPHFARQAFLPS